jgi:hypothetical protein
MPFIFGTWASSDSAVHGQGWRVSWTQPQWIQKTTVRFSQSIAWLFRRKFCSICTFVLGSCWRKSYNWGGRFLSHDLTGTNWLSNAQQCYIFLVHSLRWPSTPHCCAHLFYPSLNCPSKVYFLCQDFNPLFILFFWRVFPFLFMIFSIVQTFLSSYSPPSSLLHSHISQLSYFFLPLVLSP